MDMIEVEKEIARATQQLRAELAAAQATIADMREALEEIGNTACGEASHQYIALTALALPTNLDALHEVRAQTVEKLMDTPFFSEDQKEYLAGVAAAHRAISEQ